MKPILPLVQWTPEIYLLFFFLWWTNTYSLDINELSLTDYKTLTSLLFTVILLLQLFLRKRVLGIAITAIMGIGSVVLAVGALLENWQGTTLNGQAFSVIVFGVLVLITNLTMVLWMGQKYKMINIISY